MPSFVHLSKTHPDLTCMCGEKAVLDELDCVLLLDSPSQQLLSYDTTFQLGDFYTLFSTSPVIPAAFLIHECKLQAVHEDFFSTCTKLSKSLRSANFPIVTDEERGIVNAVSASLPRASNIRCWNHLLQNVALWIHSHGATGADFSVYLTDVRNIFYQASEDDYRS